ncbi:unnamed protein product [Urochloa decumbens]|uniref:SWIM-type domain-containing protein n=1 Tax=Urochloa decumbens TaxID=240449 RepID=A0ABC8Y3H7_9POAL
MARPQIDRAEADAVLRELRRRTDEDDCENFHRYELDADHRLKNLFWADVDSRLDYASHGDVVVFDTTYRTNKYGAAFVPFLGLSRHRTPVIFGCGVLSDPSLDSYIWLLRTFMLSAAGQARPRSLITDGGDAVAAAVRIVFPESSHRICSWHVERAADEHLFRGSPAARDAFMSLALDDATCSPPAFEERWRGFVAAHGAAAANRRWLDAMHAKRELWAAAFARDGFFLGMASDQRTECLATRLHAGLREGMSLRDMVAHADACARALRRDVAALDAEADRSRVELATAHRGLEEHAARRFTPANFYLVREEIVAVDGFEVVKTVARGHPMFGKKVYVVGLKQRWGVFFHVECSGGGDAVKCSCRKMEREGLPCRHIFCVMIHNNSSRIPDCCVLRRLRRREDTKAERIDEMKDLGRQVFDLASEDAREFKEIKEFFEGWLEERRTGLRRSGAIAAHVDTVTPVTKKTKLIEN